MKENVKWLRRMLSHNFRMPMAIISSYGELLKSGGFETREKELECIDKICKNIDYIDKVSKIILDDGNVCSYEKKEDFDLLGCVKEAVSYTEAIAKKAHISITVFSRKQELMFFGNRLILMRAFLDLIENSIRYMNREGEIRITVEETFDEIVVLYEDNGEGMEQADGVNITRCNYQGKNGSKTGNGIGMFLVKEAVCQNSGRLEIKTGIGKGMSVRMIFGKNL